MYFPVRVERDPCFFCNEQQGVLVYNVNNGKECWLYPGHTAEHDFIAALIVAQPNLLLMVVWSGGGSSC